MDNLRRRGAHIIVRPEITLSVTMDTTIIDGRLWGPLDSLHITEIAPPDTQVGRKAAIRKDLIAAEWADPSGFESAAPVGPGRGVR